ncbi:ATP-binding protein [[Clostridium] aminophilum]|uniref:ATP-binding protein n=1 Tax=[Clostridium] aminophilum TaxID=1526 RepID=UPI003F9A9149
MSDRTREYLEKIDASAEHLLYLINDILDMSRIESGKLSLKNEEFSFCGFLKAINIMVSGQCSDKGLDYQCHIQGEVDDYYIGDDMKLRQVLINILGNTVKFTPEGGKVSLTVNRTAHYDRRSTLQFRVADTGIGMSREFLPHIFDAFSQENSSSTSKYGSSGLGMAIAKNIVEMMNGGIEAESEKGRGSVFTVTVTLMDCETDHSEAEATVLEEFRSAMIRKGIKASQEAGRADLTGRRVLLAEDVQVNTEIMMMVLQMRQMEAEHAENGRIAVEMFASHEPGYYNAVLMDMRMPEMDGLEASRAIRAMDRTDAKTIPIIALTANAFDEDVQRSMQAGLNAHLTKPIQPEKLFETLERLIRD